MIETALDVALDSDCDTISLGENCCDVCGRIVANKAFVAARREACREKQGGPPRCPSLDCPPDTPAAARCVASTCTF